MGIEKIVKTLSAIVTNGLDKFGIYYSFYIGIVIDIDDPDNLNRIKVKVPEVYGNKMYPSWVYPKSVYSGPNYGLQLLPEIGDIITIEFRHGNPRNPCWSMGFFGKDPKTKEGEIRETDFKDKSNKWFRTPYGMSVQFRDKEKAFLIKHPAGFTIRVNKDSIDLVAPDDKLINIGSFDSAAEFTAKGETLKDQNSSILDNIMALTVSTPFGPSSVPINTADFLKNKAELELLLSTKVKLD